MQQGDRLWTPQESPWGRLGASWHLKVTPEPPLRSHRLVDTSSGGGQVGHGPHKAMHTYRTSGPHWAKKEIGIRAAKIVDMIAQRVRTRHGVNKGAFVFANVSTV